MFASAPNRATHRSQETFAYDRNGNLIEVVTPAGEVITRSFDAHNRLVELSYPSVVSYAYDIAGRLSAATENGKSIQYGYDRLGRVTSFTDQMNFTSNYTHDLAGNRTSVTYPTGTVVDYQYDGLHRPVSVGSAAQSVPSAQFGYDALSRLSQVTRQNGATSQYLHNQLGELIELTHTLTNADADFQYAYAPKSMRSSETGPFGTRQFGYDTAWRLTHTTEGAASPGARAVETCGFQAFPDCPSFRTRNTVIQ